MEIWKAAPAKSERNGWRSMRICSRPYPSCQPGLVVLWFRRSGAEFDGLAVGGVTVGIGPGFFASEKRGRISQTFCGEETLQGREPVVVIMRAIVAFAAVGGGFEFCGEGSGPFLPGEMPLLGEFHGKSKGLGLPRLGENRTAGVARKLRQSSKDLRFTNWI